MRRVLPQGSFPLHTARARRGDLLARLASSHDRGQTEGLVGIQGLRAIGSRRAQRDSTKVGQPRAIINIVMPSGRLKEVVSAGYVGAAVDMEVEWIDLCGKPRLDKDIAKYIARDTGFESTAAGKRSAGEMEG